VNAWDDDGGHAFVTPSNGAGTADARPEPYLEGWTGLSKPLTVTRRERTIPSYLREVYTWAYLDRRNARLLDSEAVVTALLWGNSGRLRRALLAEVAAGDSVLQAAHVYGRLIPEIAEVVGATGSLDVIDIVPLQAALCRRKLRAYSQARVRVADAASHDDRKYDVVVCFFLLHELPDEYKRTVVDSLLRRVSSGGKAVFVDYHAPATWHPLRRFMRRIFNYLEPFAETMWRQEIRDFASYPQAYSWRTETYFGGLYQKVIVVPNGAS
jgi:ubiquinone/menaquinone biosynthesis C-methylase UbiE